MDKTGEQIIILTVIVLVVLGIFLVLLFLIFLKRKNTLLKEQIETKKQFEEELTKTQIEIREETLRNISWELHDNIGQIMTLAKIQAQNAKDDPKKIEEAANSIAKGLNELRSLSKSINPETIKNLKLEEAIKLELKRFNKLNFLETSFLISGESKEIKSNSSTILFRILQEFFSNTIKHSKASKLKVHLNYSKNKLKVIAEDNGKGFNIDTLSKGQGLRNMENRAQLIGANAIIESNLNNGTSITIVYPINSKNK